MEAEADREDRAGGRGTGRNSVDASARAETDVANPSRRVQNRAVDDDLSAVTAALARLDDVELHALVDATTNAPQNAPGLLAWIEAACDWELHRRNGHNFPLQPPAATIGPEEDAASIYTAMAMRETFAEDILADSMRVLLDAIVGLFTKDGLRP